MVNKFFYIKGGSETYYFALKRLLEQHHHTVVDFSMKDPKNFPSPYERYFVENIDYNARQNIASQMKLGVKLIYSQDAYFPTPALPFDFGRAEKIPYPCGIYCP